MADCCVGTDIFSRAPGTVVALSGSTVPITFKVDNDTALFNSLKAIVTSIGIQAQSGHQFMHAMRNTVYVYVFTERVGELVVNGLAFPASCSALGAHDNTTWGPQYSACDVYGATGLDRIVGWYECNRITTRARPIKILIGSRTFYNAFLIGMKAEIADPSTGIAQFTFRFATIPNTVNDACYESLL